MIPAIVYRGDMAKEQRPAKCIRHSNGYEVISNDGEMKILLKHQTIYSTMENESYAAVYYIMEDGEWILTNTQNTFPSVQDFFRRLRDSEEFTQAVKDFDDIENE